MPELSVQAIRLSFVYLVAGITVGMLMLINKAVPLGYPVYALLPVHIEIMVFGWLLNFILGVAFWIFPRFYKKPVRGNMRFNYAGFMLLNAGIILDILNMLFIHASFSFLAGRIFEGAGILLFFIALWSRVFRPSASHD